LIFSISTDASAILWLKGKNPSLSFLLLSLFFSFSLSPSTIDVSEMCRPNKKESVEKKKKEGRNFG
jgi:hypothetical protein